MTNLDIEALKAAAEKAWKKAVSDWSMDPASDLIQQMKVGEAMMYAATDLICRHEEREVELIAQRAELLEENTRLREALTPSADTKAAYIGEVKFTASTGFDEDGCEVWQDITVPWTTTKDIMAMIISRATQSTGEA